LSLQNGMRAHVDHEGRIVLPPEVRARLGLVSDTDFLFDEAPNSLTLRRPAAQLAKIYIEPTSRCNLDCRMCIRSSWDETQGNMSDETFKRLLESLGALQHKPVIVFGGFGEPLFHPKIVEMIQGAKEAARRVELITNGLLLSEQMAREFIHIGLDVVWFSVDRFHSEVYSSGGALLPNIERLNALRISLNSLHLPETGIVFVATRSNIAEFPALLRGASRYGVTRYMVTNVLPYTSEMCDQALYSRALDEIGGRPSLWSPAVQLPRIDLNEVTLMPLYQAMRARHNVSIHDSNLNPSGGRCPFIETGTIAVSWDGAVSPCLALMHSHQSYLSDKPRAVRRYVVGNVNETSLTEIWNNAEHLAFRRRVQEFDFSPCTLCGGCDMAEANQEDCFGNTFPTCGGCLWAWGVIQCP
jgi:MoaA/NifB/PqqE/SkfB family radical SAM enzyme